MPLTQDQPSPHVSRPFDPIDLAPPSTRDDRLFRKRLNKTNLHAFLTAPAAPPHPTRAAHRERQWTRQSCLRLSRADDNDFVLEEIRPNPASETVPRLPPKEKPEELELSSAFFRTLATLWERDLLSRLGALYPTCGTEFVFTIYPDRTLDTFHAPIVTFSGPPHLLEETKGFYLTHDSAGRPIFVPGPLDSALGRLALVLLADIFFDWHHHLHENTDTACAVVTWRLLDRPNRWERTTQLLTGNYPVQAAPSAQPTPTPRKPSDTSPSGTPSAPNPSASSDPPTPQPGSCKPFSFDPELPVLTRTDLDWLHGLNNQTRLLFSKQVLDLMEENLDTPDLREFQWKSEVYPEIIIVDETAIAFRHHAVPPKDRPPWNPESSLTADADTATNTALTHLILALERDHLARFQTIARKDAITTIRALYAPDHRTTTIHLPRHISPQPRLPIIAQPGLAYAQGEDGEYYLNFLSLDTALARTAGDLATGSFPDWRPLDETDPDPRRALLTWTGEGLDWTRTIELVDPDYIL